MRSSVICLLLSCHVAAAVAADSDVLEEVIVTSTLRQQALVDVPSSISVLDAAVLRDAGEQHFEDVLTQVPNLHWAGGTSRPRFFQLRGIGEREQWQGAPNPSVGFLIDDMDFSGVGMSATLFDVDRIEVLRGPQGLRYGANALAGLIAVRSAAPKDTLGFSTEASYGDYGTESLGAVATGPVDALNSAWRIGVQRYRSDGFRDDAWLGRDDTNNRDELTARAKWRWQPGEDTTVDLTWLHTDLDNGYDAWSIDNSRRSLADRPGKDSQQADGGALRIETGAGSLGTATVIATALQADGEYSYDEDWGNSESWLPYTYDYFYRSLSDRKAYSLEARLASDEPVAGGIAWLVGAYALDVDYRLNEQRDGVFIDPFYPEYSGTADDRISSHYDARNVALFGQLDGLFSDQWGWSFGLRTEQRDARYRDQSLNDGIAASTDTDDRETMWGGQASIHFDVRENLRTFATLSRGYKAGGFNLGEAAAIKERFAPEILWSVDVGAKGEWFERRLYADITAFYMQREDMQVSTGVQLPGPAGGYIFITDNASSGRNIGLETSVRWQLNDQLEIGGSLGLLDTRYSGYRSAGVDLSDRDQAYAPEYKAAVNATWRSATGLMARIDVTAVDDYYFDIPPNDQRADAYALTNLKAGYEGEHWSVYLWSRNVFDEDYLVRGFYFANEPPDWTDTRYTQLGEPRTVGINVTWEWN